MNKILSQEDISLVESRIQKFEDNTGCELLLVVADSSDEYPAATWRFGFIAGLTLLFIFALFFDFHHPTAWPFAAVVSILAMVWVGKHSWAKRYALSDIEINRETYEKAVEYFHTLGTTKVSHKVTAMIMVSVLEKRIIVLIDEKLKTELTQEELNELIDIMKKHFTDGNMGMGLIQSMESLETKILKDFGGKVSENHSSELANQIHFK